MVWLMLFGLPVQVARASATPAPGDLPSYSNPADYAVGAGSIDTPISGLNTWTINNVAKGTAIYIKNHDIGQLGTVTYNQVPNGWVLVKVNETLGSTFYGDGAPTGIAGGLVFTGNGILLNPQGIVTAPGSYISAQNAVLSAMRITDTDFANFANGTIDNLNFTTLGGDAGFVTNNGTITGSQSVYLVAKNIVNAGTIVSPGGLVVMATGDSAIIGRPGSDVYVEVAMTDPANHVVDNGGGLGTGPGTIDALGGKIILAAGDIFSTAISGIESLRAEAHRDITLEGGINASGNVDLLADHDVKIKDDVTTGGNLTIEAITGSASGDIYMNTDGKTLSITQNDSIAMELDFFVDNSEDTYLVATSTGGSFTSIAAPKWESITATANGDVTLNDILTVGTITTGTLTSNTGNVNVSTGSGQVLATGDIEATLGSVDITGSGGIVASADILADTGITLNNDVTADGVAVDQTFDAGGGKLWAKDTITKTTAGNLTLGGDAGVDLEGTVDVDAGSLTIEDDFTAAGNLLANNGITFAGSTVNAEFDSTAGDQEINAGGGILEATGDIIKTTDGRLAIYAASGINLTGGDSQRVDAEQGLLRLMNSTTKTGAGDLTLAGLEVFPATIGVELNSGVDVQTAGGSLTIEDSFSAGGDILANNGIAFKGNDPVHAYLDRNTGPQLIDAGTGVLEATGDIEKGWDGDLTIAADGGVNLTGDDTQYLRGNSPSKLWVKDAITKTGEGSLVLEIYGGSGNIDLDGTVDVQTEGGNLDIRDDFTATGDLLANNNVMLVGPTLAVVDGTLDGTVDQRIEARNGVLWAQGTLTKTDLGDLYLAGEAHINLDDTVDVDYGSLIIEDNFNAAGNLIASQNVTLNSNGILDGSVDQTIDAEGGTLWAKGTLEKSDSGKLTLGGDTLVNLDGIDGTSGDSVTVAAGDLTIENDVDAEGNLRASGLIHLQGTNNNLAGDVIATGSDITFDNAVVADGAGSQTFDAGTGTLWAKDTITKTNAGDLTLAGDTLIDLDGTVDVQTTTGSLTIENNFQAEGDLIATQNVTFNGPGDSTVNATLDGIGVNQLIEAEDGKVYANGYIDKTESGNLTILGGYDGGLGSGPSYNYSIFTHDVTVDDGQLDITGDAFVVLAGDIYSSGDMQLTSGNGGWGYLAHSSGTIVSATGDVEMTANGSVILLQGGNATEYVTAGEDILLNDNTEVRVTEVRKLDAGQDVILVDGKTLKSYGALTVEADRHITLGGAVTASEVVAGDLILNADAEVVPDGVGNMLAKDTITNDGGSANSGGNIIISGRTVDLKGAVAAGGNLTVVADEQALGTNGNVTAESTLDAGDNINITADDNIDLQGTAHAVGNITLVADADGFGFGSVDAQQLIADNGTIDISASDTTINLHNNVTAGTDIVLHNNTVADGGIKLEAGQDVIVGDGTGDGTTLTGEGALTVEADRDITLGGDVEAAGDLILKADADTIDDEDGAFAGGNMTAHGDITTTNGGFIEIYSSDSTTEVHGDIDSDSYVLLNNNAIVGGDITAVTDVTANGTLTLNGTWWIFGKNQTIDAGGMLQLNDTTTKTTWGNLTLLAGVDVYTKNVTVQYGKLDVEAGNYINFYGNVWSKKDMTLTANADYGSIGNVWAIGTLTSQQGDVDISAKNGRGIYLYYDVTAGDDIRLHDYTWANDNVTLKAGRDVKTYGHLQGGGDLLVEADRNIKFGGNVNVIGRLEAYSGLADESGFWFWYDDGAGSIEADGDVIADTMLLSAGAGLPGYSDSHVSVDDDGLLKTTGGDMVVEAHHDILLGGNVDSAGNLVLNADRHPETGGEAHVYGGDVKVAGTINADGTIDMYGNNIKLWDDVGAGGNIILTANTSSDFADPSPEGDVTAYGNITSTGGSIEIYSDDDTTYLGGDTTAFVNVLLNNNTEFIGFDDQRVTAETGMITANGWLDKSVSEGDGSLYLNANGDISLADYVKATDYCYSSSGGGVSIISDNGRIFTPDYGDRLNVDITGRSDHYADVGVDLPFGGEDSGKAAIIIMSGEDLQLGPDGKLSAYGKYYDDVDDRVGVGFLAVPATIGGVPRNEGDLFDAAIYVASKGDVDVSSPVSILSQPDFIDNGFITVAQNEFRGPECVPKGAMIVDARDTVTFDAALGGQFETSLANGDVGDRLEVASRITEWLFQAVDAARLPYAGSASTMSTLWYGNPDSYILRGAGLGNPIITDGRAWVLEDPLSPAPLYWEAGEASEEEEFGEGGCPALMEWLADELGVPAEEIQVFVANAFASSSDIQPCEACARLKDTSTILEDAEGAAIAALATVISEFVTTPAPPSEEQMALVATAFAEHTNDGTYYAAAGQWIDALAAYVGILTDEMGYSTEDTVAFVSKYVAPVAELGNESLTAYVVARLAALGG